MQLKRTLIFTVAVNYEFSQLKAFIIENKTHILITGIANTEVLLNHLTNKNIKYLHFNFKDHHNLTDENILKIIKAMKKESISKNLLLTEKDYYRLSEKHKKKLQQHFQLICIKIQFNFIEPDKSDFNNELLNFKKSKI